jgi:hypothetical protein
MNYYYDTEFIEDGSTIDLISIGIVADDGRTYYAINKECKFERASDWVIKNVLDPIGIVVREKKAYTSLRVNLSPNYKDRQTIAEDVVGFVNPDKYGAVVLRGYYADYDHVVLCQLFGTMMDLPVSFPMYTLDLKQTLFELGNPELPPCNTHDALQDAIWVRDSYRWLKNQGYVHPALN